MAIGRGSITLVDDAGGVQLLQVQLGKDEIRDRTPRLAEYGLTSVPPVGSEAIVIFVGGDRSMGVAIATGNEDARPKVLAAGEVAIYDDQGQMVHITRAGIIIKGAGKPVTIQDTPKVRMVTDRLEVTGDIIDRCDSQTRTMKGMRDVYNTHTHSGVQTGSGSTSVPNQLE
ncbi:phage baseplate assembly protein V [Azospirillum oryzae]|uniref:Phage baseplate assembly protein V n=1 Tax=Azospirillum oryzae TaxID=286727 RepID=A0A1X7F919_9PROT|nr:phage baseplate assembly protein V [Azospirillum oryzae]SMF48310.1 phage baseplate assembly protein V [Azospirillum oryzae]